MVNDLQLRLLGFSTSRNGLYANTNLCARAVIIWSIFDAFLQYKTVIYFRE